MARRSSARSSVGGEVDLGAVARREHDRLAAVGERAGERARACEVDGDALAQLDRGLVVRDADERQVHGAASVTRRSGSAGGRRRRARARRAAARQRDGRGSPASRRSSSATRVERPDADRDRHRGVDVAPVERRQADDDAGGEQRRGRRSRLAPRAGRAPRAAAAAGEARVRRGASAVAPPTGRAPPCSRRR